MFDRIAEEMTLLTQAHERVFLSTLTVSHHRPYDFPAGVIDFPADARESAYAMAYADQALGDFFKRVRELPWYAETLFIVVADHGPRSRGDTLIPAASYHIPMLMHHADLQARQIHTLGSSMSVPLTLVELLSLEHNERFWGHNLFCGCDSAAPMEYGYHVGLLTRDQLNVLTAAGDYVSWQFNKTDNTFAAQPRAGAEANAGLLLDTFAPAYRWLYQH